MPWREVHTRWWVTLGLTTGLILPSLWDVLATTAQTSGDIALIELRVRDVLSTHPPLTGAYSRYGWDHPGPMFFWMSAIPYRLLGGGALALSLIALALNASGIVVLLRLAARLARAAWFVVAGTLVALVVGLPPAALTSVWNVTITNVPLLLFVVASWCVWCRVTPGRAGWVALVAGSFVVQSHVGTGVVIAPLALATACVVIARWWRADRARATLVRPGLAVGALWVLPIAVHTALDPPGNFARLLRWSVTHEEPQVGWGTAIRLVGRTSSLTFVGEPRLERGVFLDIDSVGLGFLPGLALVLLAAAGFVAWRAGWRTELTWCAIVGSLWISGLVAASTITRPLGWWLVQWLEPLGWMTWSAILIVAWRVAGAWSPERPIRSAAPVLATTALLLGVAVHAADVVRAHAGSTFEHDVIVQLAGAAATVDRDRPLAIVADGEPLLADATLAGVVAALDRRGVDTCVEARLVDRFRGHRVCADAPTRLLLRLERSAATAPPGSTTLQIVDPLTPGERRDADRIAADLAAILERDGRTHDLPLLATPLADVVLLDDPSPELADRAGDARRLASLRGIAGDRYGLYLLTG